jgi:hypothetical protein
MDDLDIVRAWHRRHSDGTMGVVNGYRDGTFSGGLEKPNGEGGIYVGSHRPDVRTVESAMKSADMDAGRSGHRCDHSCEAWHEISMGTNPQH